MSMQLQRKNNYPLKKTDFEPLITIWKYGRKIERNIFSGVFSSQENSGFFRGGKGLQFIFGTSYKKAQNLQIRHKFANFSHDLADILYNLGKLLLQRGNFPISRNSGD